MEEEFDEAGAPAPPNRARHIKKRTLKNKSLSVSFNEKDLRDFVTGFHKRKKKRRKEAQKQQEEVLRRKRIEARKKRKLEQEMVLNVGELPTSTSIPSEVGEYAEDEEEPVASVSGTALYDTGDMKVTVTTSEMVREEEEEGAGRRALLRPIGASTDKKQPVPVRKTKPFKKGGGKRKSRPKAHGKRDKKRSKQSKKSR